MRTAVVILSSLLFLACEQDQAPARAAPKPQSPVSPKPGTPSTAPAPTPDKTTASASPEAAAQGKDLYMKGCANCHGMDGTGSAMRKMLPKIGDLSSPELHARMSDADIATLVANGRDKMPPFKTVFTPEQINAIVAYTRTLKK